MVLKLLNAVGFLIFCCNADILLPFGSSQNDHLNPKLDDGCGEKIALPFEFTFYEKSYQSIWVCNNGILSFSGSTTEYVPIPFPVNDKILICAFWADVDNRGKIDDGNEIYWRLDTRRSTLQHVSSVITSNTATSFFGPTWALVATWYKVGYYPEGTDLLNTFQIVLTCDEKSNCFCFLVYVDINWTASRSQQVDAQAGFNDGTGNYEMLLGSRTSGVRNLVKGSNVGINGLFVYKVTESGVDAHLGCSRKMEPRFANMYFEPCHFKLQGFFCDKVELIDGLIEIPVVFIGQSYNITTKGIMLKDQKTIAGKLPFWGKAEQVRVLPLLEGIETREAVTMQFLGIMPEKSSCGNPSSQVRVTESGNKDTKNEIFMTVEWDPAHWTHIGGDTPSNINITVYVVQYIEVVANEVPFKIKVLTQTTAANIGRAQLTSFLEEGTVFVVLDLQSIPEKCQSEIKSFTDCGLQPVGTTSPVANKIKQTACKIWHKMEKEKLSWHKEPWFERIANVFGCPRNSIGRKDLTDAWFARRDVTSGLNGWEYDPCCSPTHLVVDPHCFGCQYNVGAEFCIQSPGLVIEERDRNFNKYSVLASNQCCYGRSGKLLRSEMEGAGNTKRSVNSPETYLDFLHNEISPYLACEEEKLKNLFYEVRPIRLGSYVPRRSVINWGDPHIKTLDGFEYTFNGLGVYVMTKTRDSLPNNLTMHVSTRRVGDGTVFSGFAIQDRFTFVELYRTVSDDVIVTINGSHVPTNEVSRLTQDGVLYKKNLDSTEFMFKMVQSDFTVKAIITQNGVLNLGISPPFNFESNLLGLLGNYDGNSENELLNKNGTTISNSVSLMTIHEEFGESWAVAEEFWLFSLDTAGFVKDDIARGMPYTPVYTPQFKSEHLKRQAEELCGEDHSCLLDTALTGRLEFGQNAVQMKIMIKESEVLNDVVDEYIKQTGPSILPIANPFLVFMFSYAAIKIFKRYF